MANHMEISNFIFFPVWMIRQTLKTKTLDRLITSIKTRNGGGKRDRTDDLLLAKQALYQLS